MTSPPRSELRRRCAGAALIVVLLTLMIVGMLTYASVRVMLFSRRQVTREQTWLQADWLAKAGISRARARLRADPAYAGETWTVPAEMLGPEPGGRVVIQVETPAGQAQRRTIRVQAVFPETGAERVQRTRTDELDLPGGGSA